VLGAKWKELSAEAKAPFEDRAKALTVQYKEDKAKYDLDNPDSKKRKSDGGGSKKSKKAKKVSFFVSVSASASFCSSAPFFSVSSVSRQNPQLSILIPQP
jgi:hypothetical protein